MFYNAVLHNSAYHVSVGLSHCDYSPLVSRLVCAVTSRGQKHVFVKQIGVSKENAFGNFSLRPLGIKETSLCLEKFMERRIADSVVTSLSRSWAHNRVVYAEYV